MKLIQSSFFEILDKNVNCLRIPREPFVRFEKGKIDLNKISFPKINIENWNYCEFLDEIRDKKLEAAESEEEQETIKKIFIDIKDVVKTSFELSDSYTPHEVSLTHISGTPCTKFHADILPIRIVCTYHGPGTVFLPRESTRYACLNRGGENRRIHIKDTPVFQADNFDVLVMKGRSFNRGEIKPCAHRSPDVLKGEERLVLKVDFK